MVKIGTIQLIHPFHLEEREWCFWKRKNSEDQAYLLINILMADHPALLPKIPNLWTAGIYGLRCMVS